MAKFTKTRLKSSQKHVPAAASEPVPCPPRPGGKLGVILERLSVKSGATADELVEATGWQRHSVLGALSKLKARGFPMRLDVQPGRKAYRLDTAKE